MKTRIVKVRDISKDDETAWSRLSDRALEPNPFLGPDFLILSCRYFEDYADAKLVIAQEGADFKGVLPISLMERAQIPPRRVARIRSRPRVVTCLDTPLVDRSNPDQSIDALVDALHQAAQSDGWPGIVLFDQIGADGPVADSLLRACAERRYPVFVKDSWERAMLRRSGRWADPVDAKRRREIARRQRLLEKMAGAEVTLVDRTSDPAAPQDFLAMESSGWKGREGGKAFARSADQAAWFKEWHSRCVAAGRLTVLALNVASVSIAMQYFVRAGEGLFCFRIAFDETYATYGPGAMLLISALNHLRENTDAAWVDSTSDKDNAFFLGMMPERRTLSTLLIGTGGAVDRAMVSALPTMTKLAVAVKGVVRTSSTKPSIRRA